MTMGTLYSADLPTFIKEKLREGYVTYVYGKLDILWDILACADGVVSTLFIGAHLHMDHMLCTI